MNSKIFVNNMIIDFLEKELNKTMPDDCESAANYTILALKAQNNNIEFEEKIDELGADAGVYDDVMSVTLKDGMTEEQRSKVIELCKENKHNFNWLDLYGATAEEEKEVKLYGLSEEEKKWISWYD